MSLKDIISGNDIAGVSTLSFENLLNAMIRGGWPESLNIAGDNKYKIAEDYVKSLLTERIQTVDGVERSSLKMNAVLKSLSRNISTCTSKSTILEDVKSEFSNEMSRKLSGSSRIINFAS